MKSSISFDGSATSSLDGSPLDIVYPTGGGSQLKIVDSSASLETWRVGLACGCKQKEHEFSRIARMNTDFFGGGRW